MNGKQTDKLICKCLLVVTILFYIMFNITESLASGAMAYISLLVFFLAVGLYDKHYDTWWCQEQR